MTLLDKAKAYDGRSKTSLEITDEVVELALAWMSGEIKDIAARIALNQGNQIYPTIARALKRAYQQKRITINDSTRNTG